MDGAGRGIRGARRVNAWRSKCGAMELRQGDYRDVLPLGLKAANAVITDPPYGERTHSGQQHDGAKSGIGVDGLGYAHWTAADVDLLVDTLEPACSGWFCVFSCHKLQPFWEAFLEARGRYVFAPLACVQPGQNVRLQGDGPSNWATWLTVARTKRQAKWGALPGSYVGPARDRITNVRGAKPLWMIRAIIRDYTRPGDLILDPCAGGGTTLLAAAIEGRRAIGAEIDPATWEKAVKRLSAGYTPAMF